VGEFGTAIGVVAVSGTIQGVTDDVYSSATSATGACQPGAVTPITPYEVLVSVASTQTPSWSVDSGFQVIQQSEAQLCLAIGFLIQTAPAEINPTWTTTDSGPSTQAGIIGFRSATG
jgi:hypothetical protein